jgi:stearoyl-CoA desaturase (delta-9 desaturase)
MIEFEGPQKIQWHWKILPFFLVHVACLSVFFLPFAWWMVGLAAGLYVLRMFGITGGYHRYFSHRTFKTSRVFQAMLAIFGLISFQKGPLWWAAHHRHHHRHSDEHGDLHSPGLQGFLWAHMGWILTTEHDETDYDRIADYAKYPELVWLNEYNVVPGVVLGAVLFAAGGLPALVWGLFVSTVCTWHATFAINSLTHMFGKRRYATKDDSRNNWLLAIICMGEGWHNNHHYYKSATRQGFYWWEVDLTYYILRALAAVGIVWDLKEPSEEIKNSNRVDGKGEPAVPEPASLEAADEPEEARERAA